MVNSITFTAEIDIRKFSTLQNVRPLKSGLVKIHSKKVFRRMSLQPPAAKQAVFLYIKKGPWFDHEPF